MPNSFDYTIDFQHIDFRKQPHLYKIGIGEQGVLLVEPYKSELLPHWRFRTEHEASESAQTIYDLFERYLAQEDFVGADMARKYLQMGFTRARRYANHPKGRKYTPGDQDHTAGLPYPYSAGSKHKANPILPQAPDATTNEKARAAAVFKTYWDQARQHPDYLRQKTAFKEKYYI